jgi:hypothetical protein
MAPAGEQEADVASAQTKRSACKQSGCCCCGVLCSGASFVPPLPAPAAHSWIMGAATCTWMVTYNRIGQCPVSVAFLEAVACLVCFLVSMGRWRSQFRGYWAHYWECPPDFTLTGVVLTAIRKKQNPISRCVTWHLQLRWV